MKANLKFPSHSAGKLGAARFCYREKRISLTVVIVGAKKKHC